MSKIAITTMALAGVLLSGSRLWGAGATNDVPWGEKINGVALGVRPDRPVYGPADQVRVTVFVENFGGAAVRLLTTNSGEERSLRLELFNDDGTPARRTDLGRPANSPPYMPLPHVSHVVKTLESGDKLSVVVVLNDYFDLSHPGRYRLVVLRPALEGDFLVSNMASIDITAK